jgi:hypothetical protein
VAARARRPARGMRQEIALDRDLHVVPLQKAVRAFHDPRLGIGEVVLRLRIRLRRVGGLARRGRLSLRARLSARFASRIRFNRLSRCCRSAGTWSPRRSGPYSASSAASAAASLPRATAVLCCASGRNSSPSVQFLLVSPSAGPYHPSEHTHTSHGRCRSVGIAADDDRENEPKSKAFHPFLASAGWNT